MHINRIPQMAPLRVLAAIRQTEVKGLSFNEGKLLSSLKSQRHQGCILPNNFHIRVLHETLVHSFNLTFVLSQNLSKLYLASDFLNQLSLSLNYLQFLPEAIQVSICLL